MEVLNQRFKLTQFDVFGNAPQGPGAYALLDESGMILWMAWATDLSQQLTKHLPANERNTELSGRPRFFCLFQCKDESAFAQLFDSIVESLGALPIITSCIPAASRYASSTVDASSGSLEALLARVRRDMDANNIESAFELVQQARQEGEGHPEYHLVQGQLIAIRGFVSAIDEFEKAAEKDPTSPFGLKAAALAERCYDLLVGFRKL